MRLERTTTWSQTTHSNQLNYIPIRGRGGIRIPGTLLAFACFQDKCIKPLCHSSKTRGFLFPGSSLSQPGWKTLQQMQESHFYDSVTSFNNLVDELWNVGDLNPSYRLAKPTCYQLSLTPLIHA